MYYRQKRSIIEYNNKKTFYVISTERYVINKLNEYHREYYDKFDSISRIVNRLYNKLNDYEFKYFSKYNKIRDYKYLKNNIDKNSELENIKEIYDKLPKSIRLSALYDVSDRWFRYYHRLINSEVNEIDMPNVKRRKGKYRFSFTIDPNKITIIDNYDNSGFDIKRYKYLMLLPKDIMMDNNIIIPVNHINSEIIEIRVSPNRLVFNIDIKYKVRRLDTILYKHLSYKEDYRRIAAIDFGIDNLMAIANNIGAKPLLIKGKEMAYVNKKYNYLLSLKRKNSKSFIMLKNKRDKLIKEYLDKSVNLLIDYLDINQIKLLVLGISSSLSNSFNSDLEYSIDYNYLIKRIEYKCLLRRIHIVKVDESKTSKYSYFDYDNTNSNGRYNKRLYISDKVGVINCDINSAINIMLKYNTNAMDSISNKFKLNTTKHLLIIKEIGIDKFRYINSHRDRYSNKVNAALKVNESVKAEMLSPIVIKNIFTDKVINYSYKTKFYDYIDNNKKDNKIANQEINRLLYYKNLSFLDTYQKYYY